MKTLKLIISSLLLKRSMNHLAPVRISIRSAGNVVSRSSSQNGFLVGILALVCFALTSTVRAVTPAPDGIGFEALLSQQPSQFVFKDASGKATSVDVVETYQPKSIARSIPN